MAETLLPANATPLETAIARVGAARRPLPTGLVKAVWNPWACPEHMLPILANQLSVDVWDAAWDEIKKRQVIAASIHDQKRKGTLATLRAYASYRDAEIVQVDRPPQRFFAGGSETPAEREAWIAGLPQIRLYEATSIIPAVPRIIAGGGKPFFLKRRYAWPSSAPVRAGGRAVLWRDGAETLISHGNWDGGDDITLSVPGRRGPRLHAGRTVGAHACPSVATAHLYRILLDPAADLTPIAAGTRLQTTRPELVSTQVPHVRTWFARACAWRRYARASAAAVRIWRRIPILTDDAPPQPRRSVSYASVTRLAVPPRTAELGVDIPGRGSRLCTYARVRCAGLYALPSVAATRIRPTFAALAAGKRLADTLLINTNLHRPLLAGTALFAGQAYRAGQWTRL